MLLSIVMMVKNESKILERTLKSLELLREEIDSELIILDTGSTDDTVNIARKYTDNVYIEKWNDDFSYMRNKSISYAKGEWLLIIDADEVLVNHTNIIKFFDQKLYKKYNSATIRMKNIYSYDEKKFGDCSLVRFFKNENFEYEGIIHEQPKFKQPIYNNLLEFKHYGYLFEDEELRIRKIKRNEELLLKELKLNPKDPYTHYQIAKNLIGEDKYIEAEEYLEKSLKYYKDIGISPEYVFMSLAKTYLNIGKNKKCEELCRKYINKDRNNIDMYYFLATAQLSQEKFEDSIKSYKRYIYLVDNYNITTQANSIYCDSDAIGLKEKTIAVIIKILNKLERYDEAIDYFDQINDKNIRNSSYSDLFKALHNTNKVNDILKYYNKVEDLYVERNEFYNALEIFIKTLKSKDKNKVYKLFMDLENNYGIFNKIRYENNATLDECIEILSNEKEVMYGAILNVALDNNLDLLDIVINLDNVWIEKYITYSIGYDRKILPRLYDYIINVGNTFDFERIRVYKIISSIILQSDSLKNDKYIELFYINNMYCYQYIKEVYRGLNDNQIIRILPSDYERFMIEFRQLIQNNYTEEEKIQKLKMLLIEYPYYKKVIQKLIEDINSELSSPEELKILRKNFVENIIKMVNYNQLENAKKMLSEYLDTFNENVEILNIKGVIAYMENDLKESEILFKKSLSLDLYNDDTIYNIESIVNN